MRLRVAGATVFAFSLAFFLCDLGDPAALTFDENWYVPTARDWLVTGIMAHQEHPPLGKLLIAFSIWLFGDTPFGWRAMSAVFGAVTLTGIFFWSFALLGNVVQALWASAIAFLDGAVLVQARIAMLDIFLMAFCALALAFFSFSFKEESRGRSTAFALAMGVTLGLATACKWSGLFLLFGLFAIYLLIALLRTWHVRFENPEPLDFFAEDVWPAMTPLIAVAVFCVTPFCTYFATYLPQIVRTGSLYEFAASHQRMYEIMSGYSSPHAYASSWFTWLWMERPVWYYFVIEGRGWGPDDPASAIVALVNPFILAAGEIAVAVALLRWVRFRDKDSLIVTVCYFSQFLPWSLDPKGLEFFYYYFPSTLAFGPALALAVFRCCKPSWRRSAATAIMFLACAAFVFFLPVYIAGVGVTPQAFGARIWLKSWI
jgi:dolichyl-phosphate-mannose-protein mannosyltransferase